MYPSWIPKKPKFKQNPESSTSFDCLNSSCGMDWSKKLGQQLTMEGIKENTSITHPGNFEDCAHEKFLKGQHMLIYYCGKKWGYYCRILHRCVESLPDWSHQPQIRWREVAWLPSLQLLYVGLVEKKKASRKQTYHGFGVTVRCMFHIVERSVVLPPLSCFVGCMAAGREAMEFSGFIPGLSESLFFQNGCNPLGSKTNQQKYHQVYNLVFLHPKTWTDSTLPIFFKTESLLKDECQPTKTYKKQQNHATAI